MKFLDVLRLAANIAVVVTVVVVAIQARIALKQFANSVVQKKRDRALSLIGRWNDLAFAAHRHLIMIYFKNITMANFSEHVEEIQKDMKLRGNACSTLNFLEELALGVNRDVYDFNICYTFFHPVTTYYWELMLPFVQWLRERDKDESIFREVERMYHAFVKKTTEQYAIPPGRYWSA